MRFYLLDKITNIEIGKTIEGVKCWSLSNEIFNEHFPGRPIVPGTLLIESMAQLISYLISETYKINYINTKEVFVLLALVHKAKFRSFVAPGDKCILKAELINIDINRASGSIKIFVENNFVAEANLSFIIGTEKDYPMQKNHIEKTKEYYQILTSDIKKVEK